MLSFNTYKCWNTPQTVVSCLDAVQLTLDGVLAYMVDVPNMIGEFPDVPFEISAKNMAANSLVKYPVTATNTARK